MNNLRSLQYISTNSRDKNLFNEIKEVLDLGVTLVQIRLKNLTDKEYEEELLKILPLINEYNASLIVNDNIDLAVKYNLNVHLGKNDFPILAAKKIMPNNSLIGATCNTTEDIIEALNSGASYIGLGPYRYTKTKQNLSPVLNEEGLIEILADLGEMSLNPKITLVGGIKLEDLSFLKKVGIKSIAVSSLISKAGNKEETIKKIKANGFF